MVTCISWYARFPGPVLPTLHCQCPCKIRNKNHSFLSPDRQYIPQPSIAIFYYTIRKLNQWQDPGHAAIVPSDTQHTEDCDSNNGDLLLWEGLATERDMWHAVLRTDSICSVSTTKSVCQFITYPPMCKFVYYWIQGWNRKQQGIDDGGVPLFIGLVLNTSYITPCWWNQQLSKTIHLCC